MPENKDNIISLSPRALAGLVLSFLTLGAGGGYISRQVPESRNESDQIKLEQRLTTLEQKTGVNSEKLDNLSVSVERLNDKLDQSRTERTPKNGRQ
jgi:uncharacterized protein YcfJ